MNRETSIILESKSYPTLLVDINKSYYDNTWNNSQKLLNKEDLFTLPLPQFPDFLRLLRSGKAYDGNGKIIPQKRLKQIYNEITEVRSPWRAEWLDAKFGEETRTYHKVINNSLQEVTEPLEQCLMQDKTPGINLEEWLNNHTRQGLPKSNIKEGDLYYWHTRKDCVARFNANSSWAGLSCNWYPTYSNDGLGVRIAKIYTPKTKESYTKEDITNAIKESGLGKTIEELVLKNLD